MASSIRSTSYLRRKLKLVLSSVTENDLEAIQSIMMPLTLSERRAIVSSTSENQTAILHYACYRGLLKTVEYLVVECGADVNVVFRDPQLSVIPLFIAISRGDYLMIRLLVKLGADFVWKNLLGENALVYACKYQQLRVAIYMYRVGARITGDRNVRMCAENVRYCVSSLMLGTSADAIDSKRDSIFILAAECGNVHVMNILRQFDVNIYHRNQMGNNALSAAIWKRQSSSYRYLVSSGLYTDIDIALAFELCGARTILFRSKYDEGLDMWVQSISFRLSVSDGMVAKLEYYHKNGIKPIKEFQSAVDICRLRGDVAGCIEQAHLVYTRIRNPPL